MREDREASAQSLGPTDPDPNLSEHPVAERAETGWRSTAGMSLSEQALRERED